LLVHGRWFSPGSPASSTTKTGRHDVAESGVKHQKSINQLICKLKSRARTLPVLVKGLYELLGNPTIKC
jgi:hypothetical protein